MWVGGTEHLIAEAFARARDENAILVMDEADSFLRDRTGARQSFEVTQVNELLTQMESFDGIFVASTNLVDALDAASLRRFDFRLKFDYLARDQRRRFFARICPDAAAVLDADAVGRRLDRLDCLTPGDFTNVLRQFKVRGEPVNARECVELLGREMAIKPEGRKRSMGFV
jgi:SpoVK/Ycf46/Vps4 family AAA+-type ATPase